MGIFLLLNTCFNLQLPIINSVLKKLKMKEKQKVSKDQDGAVKMLQTEEGSLQPWQQVGVGREVLCLR